LRENIKKIILDKKKEAEKDKSLLEKGDLMTILLSDDLFKDDIEMIIDECLTFFLAGTQTTSALVGNTIALAMRHPEVMKKINAELNELMVESQSTNLYDCLTLDNLSNLGYLQMCLNESMRYEAPLSRSTSMMMTEDINCGKFTIK
jgi:cytochrome P450